jgi:hypothetical protein
LLLEGRPLQAALLHFDAKFVRKVAIVNLGEQESAGLRGGMKSAKHHSAGCEWTWGFVKVEFFRIPGLEKQAGIE